MASETEIMQYAHLLCMKYANANQYNARERNEKIISILEQKYGIDRAYAEYCFINNNTVPLNNKNVDETK